MDTCRAGMRFSWEQIAIGEGMGVAALILFVVVLLVARKRGTGTTAPRISSRAKGRMARLEAAAPHEVDAMILALKDASDRGSLERALLQALKDATGEFRARLLRLADAFGLVERLMKRLREGRAWVDREEAVRGLGVIRTPRAVPELLNILRNHAENRAVRDAAADVLSQLGSLEAIPLLLKQFESEGGVAAPVLAERIAAMGEGGIPWLLESLGEAEQPSVRLWSARMLGSIGAQAAVTALMARLDDRDDKVRAAAAEALGRIKDRSAVRRLIQTVLRDPTSGVRSEAARALGGLADPAAFSALVELLGDPDHWTRIRAIEALEVLAPDDLRPIEAGLSDASMDVRKRAALALDRLGAVEQNIEKLLGDGVSAVEEGQAGLTRLVRAGLWQPMLEHLAHPEPRVRAIVATVLAGSDAARVGPALTGALRDSSWVVRLRAVEALFHLKFEGLPKALRPLIDDPEIRVQRTVIQTLAASGAAPDGETVSMLESVLVRSADPVVRGLAVRALGTQIANPDLDRALGDFAPEVRVEAARIAAQLNPLEWETALIDRLADADARVRVAAAQGLAQGGSENGLAALERVIETDEPEFRSAVARGLARTSALHVSALFDQPEICASISSLLTLIEALGLTKEDEAVDRLASLATHESESVRAKVAEAAIEIGDHRTESILMQLLNDPALLPRTRAIDGLGTVGTMECIPILMRSLDDPDESVRNRVPLAFGCLGGDDAVSAIREILSRNPEPPLSDYAVVGWALTGDEQALEQALTQLSDTAARERTDHILRGESPAIRARFYRMLLGGLRDASAKDEPLSLDLLANKYATVVRSSRNPEARQIALRRLRALGSARFRNVIVNAVRTDPVPELRVAAIEALVGDLDEDSLSAVLDALSDPVASVRVAAAVRVAATGDTAHNAALLSCFLAAQPELDVAVAYSLSSLNRDDVTPFIERLMSEDSELVRRGAATVLASIASPAAITLLNGWLSGGSAPVAVASIYALARIGTGEATSALVDALTHDEPVVRLAAAKALSELDSVEPGVAREGLSRCLTDPDETIRLAAVNVFVKVPQPDAIEALMKLCRDPSMKVRMALAKAVGTSGNPEARRIAEQLSQDPEDRVRVPALHSLVSLGDLEAVRTFVTLLPDEPESVKSAVRRINARHPAVLAAEKLAGTDPRPEARMIGLRALGGLGHKPPVLLVQALVHPLPEVRLVALELAVSVKSDDVEAAIRQLERDPDPQVRAMAGRHVASQKAPLEAAR